MIAANALSAIPAGLRDPLLEEYRQITQNYAEHRWSPAELSGGKFCEIVYSILRGHASGNYPTRPEKPGDFLTACRSLEANTTAPRSFRILIPRMLPALYEIRNNRGVGHAGGDVDPNHMDATFILSSSNWIMGELVRVLHKLQPTDAQSIVDSLIERQTPLVWQNGDLKRVLDPKMALPDQVLLLIAASPTPVSFDQLLDWTDYKNKSYFKKLLTKLHNDRLINLSKNGALIEILPPGSKYVAEFISRKIQK